MYTHTYRTGGGKRNSPAGFLFSEDLHRKKKGVDRHSQRQADRHNFIAGIFNIDTLMPNMKQYPDNQIII